MDNASTIAQEEIFGPVLSVIPVDDEEQIVATANDTIYGLNASVFTHDVDRARDVARRLRSGTVGHNAFRTDFGIAFGGFKQSGIGREGGTEGLLPFLETKTVILEGRACRLPLTGGWTTCHGSESFGRAAAAHRRLRGVLCQGVPGRARTGGRASGHDAELWASLRAMGALGDGRRRGVRSAGAPPCSTWPSWRSNTAGTSGPLP